MSKGMSKRGSGPPRRPRNPIAKNVRTPQYQARVVPDKRWVERLKQKEDQPLPGPEEGAESADEDTGES